MKNKLKNKIVHIIIMDKFIPPFIDFINEHFDESQHSFIILGKEKYKFGLTKEHNVIWINTPTKLLTLGLNLHKAKKIIMHGLWSKIFNTILFVQPSVLKKTYWIMWGADLYEIDDLNWVDKYIRKKIGNVIGSMKGEYELAKKWYGIDAKYHYSFVYPTKILNDVQVSTDNKNKTDTINIQIGNSADPTNNHFEILDKLEIYKDKNIKIYAPLSYGDKDYAKKVIKRGKEIFSDKFIALTDFMPLDEYTQFLSQINIAIFSHKRQQAVNNITNLLTLGKKVYMRSDISSWEFFRDLNVYIYDVENIDLELLENEKQEHNKKVVKEYFSEENLVKQFKKIWS